MSSLEPRRRGELRASDGDRDACARALRAHYAHGRIDEDELEERLETATRARTQGELKTLLRDLPRAAPRGRGPLSRAALRTHAATFTVVNGGLTGIWAATGEGAYWPGGVLAPWAVLLAGHVLMRRGAKRAQAAATRHLPKRR